MLRWFLAILLLTPLFGDCQNKNVALKITGLPQSYKIKENSFIDSLSATQALRKQLTQLQLLGYFDVELEKLDFKNDTLFAVLNKGNYYKGVFLKNGNVAPELIDDLNLKNYFKRSAYLPLNDVNKFYQTILDYYQNNGYPFVQMWMDSLKMSNDEIEAHVFVAPNKKIIIDTIRVIGNANLSQSFLNSYLSVKNNQTYSEEKIVNITKRLRDLPYIKVLRSPEIVFSGNNAKVNLFMDKQSANQFDGIIGFLPNSNNGKLQITGDFKLNLKNALKSGETIDFNYRGLPSHSQELNLALNYPYIFKSQLGVNASFQLFKRDTSFLNINTRLGFDYNLSLTNKASFFLERFNGNQVADSLTSSTAIPANANINSVFYGLALTHTNLDNKLVPKKGVDLTVQAAVGQRKLGASKNFNPSDFYEKTSFQQFKIVADLKAYIQLHTKAVFYLHNNSALLTGSNMFQNEAFRIGGFKSLRGFDEQSINTSSYSIQTAELRYFIERASYINIFYDHAYVQKRFVDQQSTDYPLGFGGGITFQTKIGLTSLSYALGKQKNIPLDLQNGKIHFGILSYF